MLVLDEAVPLLLHVLHIIVALGEMMRHLSAPFDATWQKSIRNDSRYTTALDSARGS